MALVHDPKLLILDEPTSGLDPHERDAMLNRIRILARQFGKSILLCTHILPDVQSVCDFVTIIAAGRVRLAEQLEVLRNVRDPSLTVQTGNNSEPLQKKLADTGIRTESVTNRVIRVFGDAESISIALWSAAQQTGTMIRSIQPSRNSLEQIFLDAIRGARHADS